MAGLTRKGELESPESGAMAVGEEGLLIALVNAADGADEVVVGAFREAWEGVTCYDGLDRTTLAFLYPTTDFMTSCLRLSQIRDCQHIDPFLCFQWITEEEPSLALEPKDMPVLGICFAQAEDGFCRESLPSLARDLSLSKARLDVENDSGDKWECRLLGSFGVSNLVILLQARSVQTLSSLVAELGGEWSHRGVSITYVLPCLWREAKATASMRESRIGIQVVVHGHGATHTPLPQSLGSQFADWWQVVAPSSLCACSELAEAAMIPLVRALRDFRRKNPCSVHSTECRLAFPAMRSSGGNPSPGPGSAIGDSFGELEPWLDELKVRDMAASCCIVGFLGRLACCLRDSRVRPAAGPVRRALDGFQIGLFSDDQQAWFLDNPRDLEPIVDYLGYGLQQRMRGIPLQAGMEYPDQLRLPGGVGRILAAIDRVCAITLEGAGLQWPGLAIAGYTWVFRRFPGSVLNVPYPQVYEPEAWWHIFHELGHECASAVGLLDLKQINDAVAAALEDREGDPHYSTTRDRLDGFAGEVFATMFTYAYAHGRQEWNAYLGREWRRIASHPNLRLAYHEYVARFAMAAVSLGEAGEGGERSPDMWRRVVMDIDSLVADKCGRKPMTSEGLDGVVRFLYAQWRLVAGLRSALATLSPPPIPWSTATREAQEMWKGHLQHGLLPPHAPRWPAALLAILSDLDCLTFRQRVAVVMCLENAARLIE
jgi:hypothetical protein